MIVSKKISDEIMQNGTIGYKDFDLDENGRIPKNAMNCVSCGYYRDIKSVAKHYNLTENRAIYKVLDPNNSPNCHTTKLCLVERIDPHYVVEKDGDIKTCTCSYDGFVTNKRLYKNDKLMVDYDYSGIVYSDIFVRYYNEDGEIYQEILTDDLNYIDNHEGDYKIREINVDNGNMIETRYDDNYRITTKKYINKDGITVLEKSWSYHRTEEQADIIKYFVAK